MATICKHPKVRIVSRHEDCEYVECLECGDVFDSEEFRDMEIEENAESEPSLEDVCSAFRPLAHLHGGDGSRVAARVKRRRVWPVYLLPCPLAA